MIKIIVIFRVLCYNINMEQKFYNGVKKPVDWPQNEREARLSNVLNAVEQFNKEPSFANKELLISLITISDTNEYTARGLFRITDYEVAILNQLYLYATLMCFHSLKIFVYNEIAYTVQNINILSKITKNDENINNLFNSYAYMDTTLKIYMLAIHYFNYYKKNSLANEIINVVNEFIKLDKNNNLKYISTCYNILLLDLSFHTTIKGIFLPEFNYREIKKLLKFAFRLIKDTNQNILKSPLKGTLKIMLSNWILRARNQYSQNYFYKCMSKVATSSSLNNHEIWMRDIKSLNDNREGQLLNDLFIFKTWIKCEWAKTLEPQLTHKYYVNCFSRTKPNKRMIKEYGNNIFGFKTDKIADEISPIIINTKYRIPQFGQVVCFDVLYSKTSIKKELNYLFSIIDLMLINDEEKKLFAQEILEYWIYSIKDNKWKSEKERRYQIFLYPTLEYNELKVEDGFLKIKTGLFLYPDFINKENINYRNIKANIFDKYCATAVKEFIQCEDCLNLDYDCWYEINDENPYKCKICGSSKYKKINPQNFKR